MRIKTNSIRAALLSLLFIFSCGWFEPPYHEARMKNNYGTTLEMVKIGSATFGMVHQGDITGYRPVEDGEQKVTGTHSYGHFEGTVTFSGSGVNRWTVVLGESGFFTIIKDE